MDLVVTIGTEHDTLIKLRADTIPRVSETATNAKILLRRIKMMEGQGPRAVRVATCSTLSAHVLDSKSLQLLTAPINIILVFALGTTELSLVNGFCIT
jgi:hypothetical protein